MQRTHKLMVAIAAMAMITAATAGPSLAGGARDHGGRHAAQTNYNMGVRHNYVPARPSGRHRHGATVARRHVQPRHGQYYHAPPPPPPPDYGYRHHRTQRGYHRPHQYYGGFGLIHAYPVNAHTHYM